MEGTTSDHRKDEASSEFTSKEWNLNPKRITRDRTSMSRRFSASYITANFREEDNSIMNGRSFRSNFTISSTASSPGYNLKDDNDPSTYSFSTALRAALQARPGCVWDHCFSPDGFGFGLPLNSKWCEAERYICNPLSGEVPLECLSSNVLTTGRGTGFHHHNLIAGRIAMSAPLIYTSNHPSRRIINFSPKWMKEGQQQQQQHLEEKVPEGILKSTQIQDDESAGAKGNKPLFKTRDMDTQSIITPTQPDYNQSNSITSGSSSTPSVVRVEETSSARCSFDQDGGREEGDILSSSHMMSMELIKAGTKDHQQEVKDGKESCCNGPETQPQPGQMNSDDYDKKKEEEMDRKKKNKHKETMVTVTGEEKEHQLCKCSSRHNGCLLGGLSSLRSLWVRKKRREQRDNQEEPT